MQDYGQRRFQFEERPKRKRRRIWVFLVLGIVVFGIGKFLLFGGGDSDGLLSPAVYVFESDSPTKETSAGMFENNIGNRGSGGDDGKYKFSSNNDVVSSVDKLVEDKMGTYGWYVKELSSGVNFGSNYDFEFTAASVNKVPIVASFLLEVEASVVELDDFYVLKAGDKEGGSGSLQYQKNGTKYSYEDLIMKIGKESDNTSVNALVKKVEKEKIQENMDEWGMANSSLEDNLSTPEDMSRLFEKIYKDNIFEDLELKKLMYKSMVDTDFEDRISVGVPDEVMVVHKIGNQIQVWNDCGIIFASDPYILCMMTDGTRESEAQDILPEISRMIWAWESWR